MRIAKCLGVVAVLLVSACGGDDAADLPETTNAKLIGPAGGTVALKDGTQVTVPAGALTARVELKVTKLELDDVAPLPPNLEAAGKPYAFEPHGLVFAVPVKISLPFDGDAAQVRPVKLDDMEDTTWQTVVGASKTPDSTLELNTAGFSVYLAARPRRGSGVITLSDGAIVTDGGVDAAVERDATVGDDAAVVTDAATMDAATDAATMDAAADAATTTMDGGLDAATPEDGGDDAALIAFTSVMQSAYVKPSNTRPSLNFGESLAIDGDTMVVGAPTEPSNATGVDGDETDTSVVSAGAAYVFVRDQFGQWIQQAYLKASNTGTGDYFGRSVAIAGDTILVGAPQERSNATGVNGDETNNSYNQSGAVYVFVRDTMVDAGESVWSQQAYLKASNTGFADWFGISVAIDGDTAVVGAEREGSTTVGINGNQADDNGGSAGAAYVFARTGTQWSQQAYLKASNTSYGDEFGGSVAISGDTIAVGAKREDSNDTGINGQQNNDVLFDSGAVYVFTRSGTLWNQQAYVKASNTGDSDRFGACVAIDGDTLVVGAEGEASSAALVNGDQTDNSAQNAGAAYVFTREGSQWSQQAYLKASNARLNDSFGISVGVSGNYVIVGAYTEDSSATGIDGTADTNVISSGAAYLFGRTGSAWSHLNYIKADNTNASDFFGYGVAISADHFAVGAYQEASAAIGINGDSTDNSASYSGAVYVFR